MLGFLPVTNRNIFGNLNTLLSCGMSIDIIKRLWATGGMTHNRLRRFFYPGFDPVNPGGLGGT